MKTELGGPRDDPLVSLFPELAAGGFTRFDSALQFYGRVNALLRSEMTVLDFGAGRGNAIASPNAYRRSLMNLRGKAARVIGFDVSEAVLENPFIDEALVSRGPIALPDASVDLVVSDNVFEHIEHPAEVAAELTRILKPCGWLCARTPHLFSLMVLASKLIPNKAHARLLRTVQPGGRASRDIFPTRYKLNSMRALCRHFPPTQWRNSSYTWSPQPEYHCGSAMIARALLAYQYLKRPVLGGELLLVFLQKRADPRCA